MTEELLLDAKTVNAAKPPRDKMVLDGKVKMTPRRREILYHIAFTEAVWWSVERDWSNRWMNRYSFVPYLGATRVHAILTYLKRNKLVRYSPEGAIPNLTGALGEKPPILLITPRGMDALLECVGGL